MKTKEEILKMTKEELQKYKWSNDLNKEKKYCSNCHNCSECFNCSSCSECFNCYSCHDCYSCSECSNCYSCRSAVGLKFAICNVELTEEEYQNKMIELK